MELAHTVMEADVSQDLQSGLASWTDRRASGGIKGKKKPCPISNVARQEVFILSCSGKS